MGSEVTFASRPVTDPVGLLDWLPEPRGALSWVRGGEGLVGWGEAARFDVPGGDRFARAHKWWSEFTDRLTVRDEVGPGPTRVA